MTLTTAVHLQSEPEIDRRDTGLRIALTVLLAIVTEILSTIVGLIVVFSLIWSFVTRRPPAAGLRNAANRLVGYDYRIARWLTYNERSIPFPFSDFPEPVEDPDWDPALGEREALGFGFDDDEFEDER